MSPIIRNRVDLIRELERRTGHTGLYKGSDIMAQYLVIFFRNVDFPEKSNHDICHKIPELLFDAMEEFRVSNHPETHQLRYRFEQRTLRPFPNFAQMAGSCAELERVLFGLARMFGEITGSEMVSREIYALLGAQRHLLLQEFCKFQVKVFQEGFFPSIEQVSVSRFGDTLLRMQRRGQRMELTFEQSDGQNITFACNDDGLGRKLVSVNADMTTALRMFTEVTESYTVRKEA